MGLVLGVALLPAKASPHLCEPHERVAFSCSVGKKTLSLCAADNLTKSSGSLQYRFGQVSRVPELVFPPDPTKHAEAFEITRSHNMQHGAHYMQILVEFQNRGTSYELHWDEAGDAYIGFTSDSRKWTNLQCVKASIQAETAEIEKVLDFNP